jgi:hypothetical protein
LSWAIPNANGGLRRNSPWDRVRITDTYEFYRRGNTPDFPHALDALEFPHHSGFRGRPFAILTTKSLALFVWFFNTRRQLSWSSNF